MRGTNVVSLWETCINNQWKYYCLNHVTVPQVSTIMQLFLQKKKKKTIMQLRERKREKGEGLWCTYIAIYTIIATGWQQWLRKILVVLGCLQHEQPLQHQHCVATHFSPKSRATIRLKKKTKNWGAIIAKWKSWVGWSQYMNVVMGEEGPECRMKADIDLFPS